MPKRPSLEELETRIETAKNILNKKPQKKTKTFSQGIGKFFNVGVELVSGVLVGVGAGLFIDWIFGTSPWGLISLFILGSMAGMRNVYKTVTGSFRGKQSKR